MMKMIKYLVFLILVLGCAGRKGVAQINNKTNQSEFTKRVTIEELKQESFLTDFLSSEMRYELSDDRKMLHFYSSKKAEKIKSMKLEKVPDEVNSFYLSPSFNTIVMFGDTYGTSKFIYFYSNKGKLLKKEEVNIYPSINYSVNGDYIGVYNKFGKQFMIYDKFGEKIYTNDNYQELIKSKKSSLSHLSVSEDGQLFLIRSDSLYLYTIDEQLLWKAPSNYVLESAIYHYKNLVVVKKLQKMGTRKLSIEGLSFKNGKSLGKIQNIDKAFFRDSSIFIEKQKKHYEYHIK